MKYLALLSGLALQTQAAVIDINTASAEVLARNLLGVGPAIAQRIISFRESEGLFPTPDSIQLVPGIGEKTYLKNRPFIRVSPQGPSSDPSDQGGKE